MEIYGIIYWAKLITTVPNAALWSFLWVSPPKKRTYLESESYFWIPPCSVWIGEKILSFSLFRETELKLNLSICTLVKWAASKPPCTLASPYNLPNLATSAHPPQPSHALLVHPCTPSTIYAASPVYPCAPSSTCPIGTYDAIFTHSYSSSPICCFSHASLHSFSDLCSSTSYISSSTLLACTAVLIHCWTPSLTYRTPLAHPLCTLPMLMHPPQPFLHTLLICQWPLTCLQV